VSAATTAAWQEYQQVTLVDAPFNDGDSFQVNLQGTNQVLRLYFVDCPESQANDETDQRRVREQRRYFGINTGPAMIEFGRLASKRTKELLARPFTVHTVFASALGRSGKARIYARIQLHDGRDLAAVLVQEGLARVKGVMRTLPDGTKGEDEQEKLRDLELEAVLLRKGCWSASDPDHIVKLRAEQRAEEKALEAEGKSSDDGINPGRPLDLNSASAEDLQRIDGIGEVLADRIVAARPFRSVEELDRVKGIGPELLEKCRKLLHVPTP
jgi:competence ComEA-like helix-hairpin-helix protein